MKRSIAAISAAVLLGTGAAVFLASPALAHDGGVSADCNSGLTINLSNYPGNSTIEGTVDGKPYPKVAFSGSYADRITWVPTVNHSYILTVVSGDGDHNFDKKFSDAITNCVPVSTPTPTPPVTTPTPTPPVVTPPVETPTPTPTASTPPSYVPDLPKPDKTPVAVVIPKDEGPTPPSAQSKQAQGTLAFTGVEPWMLPAWVASGLAVIAGGLVLALRHKRRSNA